MNRILIATDGSPAARHAVEVGLELAEHEGASVAFVHVVPTTMPASMNGFGLVGHVPYEPTPSDTAMLDEAVESAEQARVPVTARLLKGDAVAEILDSAEALDVDLIVLGSRGHGGLTATLLGSVSRGVLAGAKRPVLVVRATEVLAEVAT